MRVALRVLVAAGLLALGAGTAAAQTYSARLTGLQAVPPTGSTAFGYGAFVLDPDTKLLGYTIAFSGLAGETASHIHGPASPGGTAAPLFPLPLGSPKIGILGPLTPAQEAELEAGLWYVNIHSSSFPDGEIRGQMLNTVSVEPETWSRVKALYRD